MVPIVSLAETHRLTCSMAYLGHDVTSSNLDLSSNFDLDSPRSTFIYFDASRQEKRDGVQIISLASFVQKLAAKKTFLSFDF